MKKIVFVFIFLGSLVFQSWAQSTDDLDLSTFIHPIDSTDFIRDAGYYNWCNSFIKDDSGTYHLFYSRWPKSLGFTAWLTHSEIAHATASRLEGPYQYQETVLKGRAGFWDAVTAHNVQVRCWNNQYYMYALVLSLIFINVFKFKHGCVGRRGMLFYLPFPVLGEHVVRVPLCAAMFNF